jgi:hypothetical protein
MLPYSASDKKTLNLRRRGAKYPFSQGNFIHAIAFNSRAHAENQSTATIPYSSAALRQDLHRLQNVWEDVQSSRDRNAIYRYLNAVYGLVAWWAAEGRETDRARRALHLWRLEVSGREDSFAAVIRCTSDPAKVDKRTRSKRSRVMRYAAVYKPDSEPFDRFTRRKGGINACAARFSRRLGPRGGNGVREGPAGGCWP